MSKETGADVKTEVKVSRKRTRRRAKYITLYSSFLMKETKHELIGEPVITENGKQQWARCTRSNHSQLVNLDAINSNTDKSKAVIPATKEEAKKYSPKDEYKIGDIIFHSVWEDIGIVRDKATTSTGGNSIIVQFESKGERHLIENYH
ncbi:MAG: hypothetical protein GX372_07265 [Ignavibacteria bacterium]|nr:hypothetical protein [Ignavibacteria bacterium]